MRRLLILILFALLLVPAAAHGAGSPGIVISQVYAGGGNTGATYANDFVELLNTNATAVSLDGWSLQYASAASTSWSVTALSGTVQPGRYFLVGLASSGAIGAALPAADDTGTTNMAVSGGKVALVHDTSPLACGATAGSCAGDADLVGYGTATDYEGAAAAPVG
ncbi:MAG TPA: lamin tail domain-containing protein, partial [Gaiellaceae bacterium]|nr:lamin tail domain-containing protein [Gaiellaceae bacterium]